MLNDIVKFTMDLLNSLGKRPLLLREYVPSFIVNRIQNSIARVVWEMLENNWATPEQIDLAVKTSLGIRLPIVGVVQSNDFTGLDLVADIMKAHGSVNSFVADKVRKGHLGAKTSKGMYDYGNRSEEEMLVKRDEQYLKLLAHLEKMHAFDPI